MVLAGREGAGVSTSGGERMDGWGRDIRGLGRQEGGSVGRAEGEDQC